MLTSLPKLERKTRVVENISGLSSEPVSIEIRQMNIADAMRQMSIITKHGGDNIGIGLAAGLMCAMTNGEGDYLVPEDDRLDDILALPPEVIGKLLPVYLELNPLNADLEAKKKPD